MEIKYEEFTSKALSLVEGPVDVERVVEVAQPFEVTMPDYYAFVKKFKEALQLSDFSRKGKREEHTLSLTEHFVETNPLLSSLSVMLREK